MNTFSRTFCRCSITFLVVLLLGFASTAPGFGAEALNYHYEIQDDQTLDYWFSKAGLRMDFRDGDSEYTILQPADQQTVITVTHHDKQAVRLDRAFLERMIAQVKQMRKKLEQLPSRQRKMMEKSMGDAISSLEEKNLSPPTIVNETSVEWKDRSAVRGDVTSDGDTAGTVVLLDEAPLEPNEDELRSLHNFQSLMEDLLKVTGMVAESSGIDRISGNRSFHLFGDRLLRLAEFRSSEATIRLTDWERREVDDGFFSVPSDYTVKDPGASMDPGSMGGGR